MSNRHIYVCMYICGNEFCLLELFNNQILCILPFILESSHFVKIRMTTFPCSEDHTYKSCLMVKGISNRNIKKDLTRKKAFNYEMLSNIKHKNQKFVKW